MKSKPGSGGPEGPSKKTPKQVIQALLEENTEIYFREECPECGEEKSFIKDPNHLYENEEKKFSMVIPAWVCTHCGHEAFEDKEMEILLNKLEKHMGQNYTHISVKDGSIVKTIFH
jgi:hypothetical protein